MRTTLLAVLLILSAGCASRPAATVYQNSTIDALLDGNYDGELTFAELKRHGDFGLGTFDAVDGEMVALGGSFYQLRSDGTVRTVPGDAETPFSAVTFFDTRPTEKFAGPADYRQLQAALDRLRTNPGRPYATRVDGVFPAVKVRSVARQDRPFKPLAEVVKTQAVFDLTNVEGTLVGFWFPESLRHLNVPGYHFHFISKDRQSGGHVLGLTLSTATAGVQELAVIQVALPQTPPTTRPSADRHQELEKVEK